MSEAKICSRCGGPEETGDRFCRFCGVSFLTDDQKADEERLRVRGAVQQAFSTLAAPITPEAIRRAVVVACGAVLSRSDSSAPGIGNAVSKVVTKFCATNGVAADVMMVERVFEGFVRARQELQRAATAELNLPFLAVGAGGPLHLNLSLTRDQVARLEAS